MRRRAAHFNSNRCNSECPFRVCARSLCFISIPTGAIQSAPGSAPDERQKKFQFQQVQFRADLASIVKIDPRMISIPTGAIQRRNPPSESFRVFRFQFQQVQFRDLQPIEFDGLLSDFNSNRCNSESPPQSRAGPPTSISIPTGAIQSFAFYALASGNGEISIPTGAIQRRRGNHVDDHRLISIPTGAIQSEAEVACADTHNSFNSNRCNSEGIGAARRRRKRRFQFQQVQFRAIAHDGLAHVGLGFNSNRCNSERTTVPGRSENSVVSIPTGAIQRMTTVPARGWWVAFQFQQVQFRARRCVATRPRPAVSIPTGAIQS